MFGMVKFKLLYLCMHIEYFWLIEKRKSETTELWFYVKILVKIYFPLTSVHISMRCRRRRVL